MVAAEAPAAPAGATARVEPVVRVVALRCARTRIVDASCRACVDACPTNAAVFTDAGTPCAREGCDGCGLCAAACPTAAIAVTGASVDRVARRGNSVFVACDQSGVRRDDSGPLCVHAIDWRSLARLHDQGVREIVAATGNCDECARGGAIRIDESVAWVAAAVRSRGRPGVSLRYADPQIWRRLSDGAARPTERTLERRAFLRRFVAPGGGERENARSDRSVFGASVGSAAVHARVPSIDALRCDGCDACARLCPTGALVQDASGPRRRYRIEAEWCDGCRVCVDVCDRQAVAVDDWATARRRELVLVSRACSACGGEQYSPADRGAIVCRVCASRRAAPPGLRIAVD